MRSGSRAGPSTGCASSRTARTIPTPDPRLRPAAEITIAAVERWHAKDDHLARHAPGEPGLASQRHRDRVHRRRRLEERAGLRASRHLHRHHRRQGQPAHHRRLRVELAGVFARWPVPARRADVRHGHDHQAAAESRRLRRSDLEAHRRRRRHQPHRVMGSRAERAALVARWPVRLLHRGEGRHHAPVPRRRAGGRRRSNRSRKASGG